MPNSSDPRSSAPLSSEPLIPDMTPSRDDIEMRQKQLSSRRNGSARSSSLSEKPPGGSGVVALLALLIGLGAAGFSGYLLVELQGAQQQLAAANERLDTQGDMVDVLNDKLSVTDESATVSLEALKVMLKEHDSEIRKLWSIANKRNKKLIADNGKAIDQLEASSKTNAQAAKALESQLAEQALADSAMTERLGQVELDAQSLPPEAELRIAQINEALQMTEQQIRALKKADAQLSVLKQNIQQLDDRIGLLHSVPK